MHTYTHTCVPLRLYIHMRLRMYYVCRPHHDQHQCATRTTPKRTQVCVCVMCMKSIHMCMCMLLDTPPQLHVHIVYSSKCKSYYCMSHCTLISIRARSLCSPLSARSLTQAYGHIIQHSWPTFKLKYLIVCVCGFLCEIRFPLSWLHIYINFTLFLRPQSFHD